MKLVRYLLLFLTGLYCLLSSLCGADFAKLNLKLPFVNFPIFAGEILLFLSLVALAPYYCKRSKDRIKYFFAFLAIFILLKAAGGYLKHGTLALRNAALFYYLLFIYIGYALFLPGFFNNRLLNIVLPLLLIAILIFLNPLAYFAPTYLLLILALLMKKKGVISKYIFIGALLLSLRFFLSMNRTLFVGIFITSVYLVIALSLAFKGKVRNTVILAFLLACAGLIIASGTLISRDERFRSFFNPITFVERYIYYQGEIREKDRAGIAVIERKIQAYDSLCSEKKSEITEDEKTSDGMSNFGNMLWRAFVWKDMMSELGRAKPLWGVDFGRPFRSKSLIVLGWEHEESIKCGWIEPHNSYLHMIYRGGLFGLLIIFFIAYWTLKMSAIFINKKNPVGILLVANIVYWLTMANFIVLLELPYYAIWLWTFFGLTLAYALQK